MQVLSPKYQWWVDEAMRDKTSKLMACTAGLYSGKTHGAWQWLIDRIAANPDCPMFAFCEPQNSLLFDVAVPTFQAVSQSLGWIEGVHWRLYKSPRPYIKLLTTGQEIRLVGLENPEKIKGWQSAATVIDEPGVCRLKAVANVRDRTRHPKARIIEQILLTGTPEGINHYSKAFDSDTLPGWDKSVSRDHKIVHETEDGEVQYRRFRVTSYDNPFGSKAYILGVKDQYKTSPAYIKSYIYGYFANFAKGQVYTEYDPEVHRHTQQPSVHLPIVLTWDWNVQPLAWIALQKRRIEDQYGARHAWFSQGTSSGESNLIVDGCVEFIQMYPPEIWKDTPILIDGDSTGTRRNLHDPDNDFEAVHRILRDYYNNVRVVVNTNPRVELRVEATNNAFMDYEAYVHEDDEMLSQSLLQTLWDKKQARKIAKPTGEEQTHYGDAFGYPIFRERKQTRVSKVKRPGLIY